jgi:hypothetical protein
MNKVAFQKSQIPSLSAGGQLLKRDTSPRHTPMTDVPYTTPQQSAIYLLKKKTATAEIDTQAILECFTHSSEGRTQ